jgi:ketosteroid isomerase-like protein
MIEEMSARATPGAKGVAMNEGFEIQLRPAFAQHRSSIPAGGLMSQENANTIRGMYEAFGRGDVQTVIAALDPQVEWWEAENFIYADRNPYVGPLAVLEGVFARIAEEWEGFAVSPEGILDAGETIIGQGHYSGTCKRNGEHVRAQFAHFFTFRDGRVVKFQQYTDTAQFLRAVGK